MSDCDCECENYQIQDEKVKKLGEGGFGAVYLLENKKKIVKILKRSRFKSEKSFMNEVKIMKRASKNCYEHLICLDDYFIYDGKIDKYLIIITKYVNGITGKDLLKLAPYNLDDLIFIIYQILLAVDHMHNKLNIAHMDLKLENMIINPETLHLTIIDLGVSCDESYCIKSGTPGYMSPEIYEKGKKMSLKDSKKSDIFSLGVLLYELIYCIKLFGKVTIQKSHDYLALLESDDSIIKDIENRCSKEYDGSRIFMHELLKEMIHMDNESRPNIKSILKRFKQEFWWIKKRYKERINKEVKFYEELINLIKNKKYSKKLSKKDRDELKDILGVIKTVYQDDENENE